VGEHVRDGFMFLKLPSLYFWLVNFIGDFSLFPLPPFKVFIKSGGVHSMENPFLKVL
jgi:hypothetical protein